MWSSKGKDISDLSWHLAFFSDVSSQKTSLREPDNIELTLEIFIGNNFLARFLSNCLKVVENFSKRWNTNFDAVNLGIGSCGDHSIELNISWVDASISESMEHSGGDSISLWIWDKLSSLLILFELVEWGLVMLSILVHIISFKLCELVHVFVDEVHEGAALVLRVKLIRHSISTVLWDAKLFVLTVVVLVEPMTVMVMVVMVLTISIFFTVLVIMVLMAMTEWALDKFLGRNVS